MRSPTSIRTVGPSLGLPPFNLSGVMTDRKLDLFDNATGVKLNENNDWGGDAVLGAGFTSVGAFALATAATKDAALLVTIAPGQYSVQVSGADGGGGRVIVEVYEVPGNGWSCGPGLSVLPESGALPADTNSACFARVPDFRSPCL